MRRTALGLVLLLASCFPVPIRASQSEAPVSAEQVRAAIGQLGTVEFQVRNAAASTVRRALPEVAVPALLQAVKSHADGYVRFRALVLLSGFNDPRTRDVMVQALAEKNDRLRAVAYAYFEYHPDPAALPRLIEALTTEESEFVRPALTRAIAAHGKEKAAQDTMTRLVTRGQDFFRSAVIEAIGDYKGAYAFAALTEVAKLEGPLQDDAVLALGKIGDKRAVATFADLQRSAPKATQPAIAAAICLVGVNCGSHIGYLTQSLDFSVTQIGYQELLRGSATGLAALAIAGNEDALRTLIDRGAPSRDPARAAIALAIGSVALRNTPLTMTVLEQLAKPEEGLELLREAFDMLEEDFIEERFFVTVRRSYWQAKPGTATRRTAEALIRKLEF
jgi:HEAT repeat protein